MVLVFVYGTLMKGFWNHRVMERAQGRFVGRAYVKNKDMYFAYENSFPAIVDGKGVVYGEVYDVDKDMLFVLDGLEGYNKNNERNSMYLRRRTYAHFSPYSKRMVHYYLWNSSVNPRLKIPNGVYPNLR